MIPTDNKKQTRGTILLTKENRILFCIDPYEGVGGAIAETNIDKWLSFYQSLIQFNIIDTKTQKVDACINTLRALYTEVLPTVEERHLQEANRLLYANPNVLFTDWGSVPQTFLTTR